MDKRISIILPARNESKNLQALIPELLKKSEDSSWEIIIVDDGSEDRTPDLIGSFPDIKLVRHPYNKGNGAAIKTGARSASGEILVFMDADGQHDPADINRLIQQLDDGYDMVVGARNASGQANRRRAVGNYVYNWLASKMVGHRIPDLTSGFRAVRRDIFLSFLYLLPNGFSYPTTITMACFRAGYNVGYIDIDVREREGKSHIKYLRDGPRFLLIIFKIAALYSPLKVFVPASAVFMMTAISYYLFTYLSQGRFTNMGVLLSVTSILTFLLGLISEQITSLMYKKD